MTLKSLVSIGTLLLFAATFAAAASDSMPNYDDDRRLLLPADFREWTFVGSSLGLSYSEGEPGNEMFHHTLMEPSAYRHFVETGEFREGTMLALLLHDLGEGVLPGRAGRFASDLRAVELAVKDSTHGTETWEYYNFGSRTGLLEQAKAFPAASCNSCHVEHAAHDNVFLQFYPLLAQAAPLGSGLAQSAAGAPAAASAQAEPEDDSEPEGGGTLALGGLDPVHLSEGREELGKPEIVEERGRYRYQFVSEPSRAKFSEDPARFSIQNDVCLVVPGAPNDPDLWAVHDGKIYLFATPGCVAQFEADPESFL